MANKKAVTVLSKVCEIEAFPSEYAVMAHLRKVIDNDDCDDDGDDDGMMMVMMIRAIPMTITWDRCTGQESSSAVRRKVVRRRLSRTSAP